MKSKMMARRRGDQARHARVYLASLKAFFLGGIFLISFSAWVIALYGPSFLEIVISPRGLIPDFFQEYASSRNYFDGEPIYTDHALSIPKYLNLPYSPDQTLVEVNAHPPGSVLIFLPFAWLDFSEAFAFWNIISLDLLVLSAWLIYRNLGLKWSAWYLPPSLAILLLFDPLWQHLIQGQLNILILTLLVGAWAADRSGRATLGGLLIGTAGAIKLFPCYLLVLLVMRKQWRVLFFAGVAFGSINLVCGFLFGFDIFATYVVKVMPRFQHFRAGWNNFSLWGLASKLFDPAPEKPRAYFLSTPLIQSPALARAIEVVAVLAVTARLWWLVRRTEKSSTGDQAYAAAVVAMILVAPIAWEHYFVILALPVAIHAVRLTRAKRSLWPLVICAAPLWLGPEWLWINFVPWGTVAQPWQVLLPLSLQLYCILTLFILVSRTNLPETPGPTH